ncbi:MAG TPA: Dabb family protein, partial [Casimicrobiaceae bacterium]
MIAHVILFSPKADLPASTREDVLAGLAAAAVSIPSIRRFRIGTRVTHGRPGYEQMMREPFDFAAIIEFDDVAGL